MKHPNRPNANPMKNEGITTSVMSRMFSFRRTQNSSYAANATMTPP